MTRKVVQFENFKFFFSSNCKKLDFSKVELFPSNRNVCFEFRKWANNFDDFFYCFPDFCLRDEIIALDNDESSSNFKTGLKSVLKCKQKFVEFLTWFLKSLFSFAGLVLNTQFEMSNFCHKIQFWQVRWLNKFSKKKNQNFTKGKKLVKVCWHQS